MKREWVSATIVAALAWLGFYVPADVRAQLPSQHTLILAVAGAGLHDGNAFSEAQCKLAVEGQQMRQEAACAMARGVWAAYKSQRFEKYSGYIEYRQYDDKGTAESAEELARAFQNNPSIIAVIGHSYSLTTQKAAPIYRAAQIPLLMPVATDPTVGYDTLPDSKKGQRTTDLSVGQRFDNVFRLVPNDKIAQGPTIAYLIDKLSEKSMTLVIGDPKVNTNYISSMRAILRDQPLLKGVPQATISYENCGAKGGCIVNDDGSQPTDPELVVFIGTTDTANNFLSNVILDNRSARFKNLKYLILTDGCKNADAANIENVAKLGIRVLLTFPAKHFNGTEFPDMKSLADTLSARDNYSYEEYGYNAVILLAAALDSAKQPLSRPSLIGALGRIETLSGVPTMYILMHGENVHPDYAVYGTGPATASAKRCDVQDLVGTPQADTTHLHYLCVVGFDDVNMRVARGQ
jgi:hypothetical protein